MAPVTVASSTKNAYYSAGNVGWSARSLFVHTSRIASSGSGSSSSVGAGGFTSKGAQSFISDTTFDASLLRLALTKFGAPADNVVISITDDNGSGAPGSTVYWTTSVAGSTIRNNWLDLVLSPAVTITSGTKYWVVVERSGANDGSNYYNWQFGGNTINGGPNTYGGGWGSENTSGNDRSIQLHQATPIAIYQVVQDTKLHVLKSTDDGATWSEQDSANAPSVTNATYPFDVSDTRFGPYLITARFTAANTVAVRVFDMQTDTWRTSDFGTSPPSTVANTRPIRISTEFSAAGTANNPPALYLTFTDSVDDADLCYHRCSGPSSA